MTAPSPARLAGDAALLVDAPGIAPELAGALTARELDGVLDVVPGAASVLVVTEPGSRDLRDLADLVAGLLAGLADRQPAGAEPGQTGAEGGAAGGEGGVEIPVSYDGADLAEVAELTGLTVADVIARHQGAEYRVGWLGFAPGFGYLTGLDPVLARVPRLATPRVSVPAGSVAIAGGLGAVYPVASPGGWRLLGRTSAVLWDPAREPPALLAPGMRVRFRAMNETDRRAADRRATGLPDPGGEPDSASAWTGPVEIARPGPLATIQDLGRPGYGHLGVPRSGAADAASLRLANRLVGNDEGAAGLEFTLGRAVVRFHADAVVAVTGAATPVSITPAGAPGSAAGSGGGGAGGGGGTGSRGGAGEAGQVMQDRAVLVPAGAVLRLGAPVAGLRTYLAIGGGIDVPAVLGSRSSDLLSGLGPRPLRAGDRLPVGTASAGTASAGSAPVTTTPAATVPKPTAGADIVSLRVVAGPRGDWFDAAALRVLTSATYQVTPASNRTGLRLAGPALARGRAGELPSEGMVTGALEIPHDGQPILLLADHPATGGYPVIAVVHSADIGRAAQLRPGQKVRFTRPEAPGS